MEIILTKQRRKLYFAEKLEEFYHRIQIVIL
jgi:hypothetical protein